MLTLSQVIQTARVAVIAGLLGSTAVLAQDASDPALDGLRKVNAILAAKAPEDAPAFRTWLREIAANSADAASEGGFIGFGGVKVSEAEKATLAEIDAALA
jgi:hypothetical protein